MKKFLALALALVMALALAVPAMAFTDKDVAEEYVPELKIELVEYENDAFFGLVGYAPSDRGYAKNEIVAFIVTLEIADDQDNGAYNRLLITGKNVSFNVNEPRNINNVPVNKTDAANVDGNETFLKLNSQGKLVYELDAAKKVKGEAKLQWLGFAKVTGDDASITAEMFEQGKASAAKFTGDTFDVVDEDEVEYTVTASGTDAFIVAWEDEEGEDQDFEIVLGKKGVSEALKVNGLTVLQDKAGDFIFVGTEDKFDKTDKEWKALVAIVEDVFEGVFGFEYDLLGGVVDKKYFEGLVSYDKIEATVEIAPWVAYVQVPDVIVVDPPKTGDATVLVGIVMAIVAAAGVVVFNKVRA